MQIKSLHRQLYTISSYALRHNSETLPVCNRIGSLVQKWQRLDKSGLQQLLTLRRSYPTYGKAKLAVILKRDQGWTLSESTVGRMLSHLKAKGHDQPWTFKPYQDMVIGERIQIDHMTVTKNGITLKHFQAWDRVSKNIYANVYSHAKSTSVKRFLLELIETVPFKILSIQVDGGSEFRAEFEAASAELGILLLILPPRKPQSNGGVERGNRIFQDEFYANPNLLAYSIGHIRHELSKVLSTYNSFRSHFNLHGLTPLEYINSSHPEAA
jgi:putative transposase